LKRDNATNAHAAVKGDNGTAGDDAEAKDEERDGGDALDDVGEEIGFDGEIDKGLSFAAKAVKQLAFQAKSLDEILRLEGFLNGAGHAAFLLAHGKGSAVGPAEQGAWEEETDGGADDCGGGHACMNGGHPSGGQDDAADAEKCVGDDCDEAAFDGFGICDEDAEEIARFAAAKEIERKCLNVHVHVAAQIVEDARAELGPDVIGEDGYGGDQDGRRTEQAEQFHEPLVVARDDGFIDEIAETAASCGFEAGLKDQAEE